MTVLEREGDIRNLLDTLGKLKDESGMTWTEIADEINKKFNLNYSESSYRKAFKTMQRGRVITVVKKEDNNDDTMNFIKKLAENDTPENREMELRKLKMQISDERTQTNANLRRISREETIIEIAKVYAERMNVEKFLDIPSHKIVTNTNKTAILNIGDWHYGLVVDNAWNKFDPDVVRRRVALLTRKTIEYCKFHKVEKIIVVGLGDYISGIIHYKLRINSREDVMSQVFHVTEIVAEMLSALSMDFLVEFHTVFGNHGRINPDKKDSLELENLERAIPWSLKDRLANNPNINIVEDKSYDMVTFKVNDFQFGFAHGDKDDMGQIVKNFTFMMKRPFDVIITAHRHHLGANEIGNCLVFMNPSLMGIDDYAKDLRVASRPAQLLMMIGEKTPVECVYYVDLGEA